MSNNCTNCARRCNPATDCDTCPACRLLLTRAQEPTAKRFGCVPVPPSVPVSLLLLVRLS